MSDIEIKVTAEDIRNALEKSYCPPEWYMGFEVGNSTGLAYCRRADAVAINAYPSRGFETRGFEIKASKSDLKSELENGIKSDEIARFCDYWFLVTPKGLTDGFVLPPTWGVIEYYNGTLRQKHKAERLSKLSPTQGFLVAMLRGRERLLHKQAEKIVKEKEESIRNSATWSVKNDLERFKKLRDKLKQIQEETGIRLDEWEPTQYIIDRLNAAKSLDLITRNIRSIKMYAENLLKDAQEIQAEATLMLKKETADENQG